MSFPFLYDQREGPVTFANGDEGRGLAGVLADDYANFGKAFRAAEQSQIYVDNTFSRQAALEESVDRRIAAVREATGVTLPNYFRQTPTLLDRLMKFRDEPVFTDIPAETGRDAFHRQLNELAQKYPDKADRIRADLPIEDEAKALARTSEQAAQAATAPMSTAGALAASLGGGIAGSFRDPLQVSLLFAGGGSGTAATAVGRIAQVAIREGLINAGTSALMQPAVQAWRGEAGLRSGVMPALENVGMAFLFGAILGGPIQGVRELRGADRLAVERTMAGVATPEEAMTAARVLDVPEAEQGAIRMAAEAAEAERVVVGERLADVPDELDADLTAAALRNAEDPNQPPAAAILGGETPDPVIAQRLADAEPRTQAEARAVVAEAMEETGTKNIIAATRADLESGVALRGRDEAGAPIRPDPDAEIEKMPRGDPMDKMFTLDDEGRPKLVSRATLAKQGERDALFGDLVRSCK